MKSERGYAPTRTYLPGTRPYRATGRPRKPLGESPLPAIRPQPIDPSSNFRPARWRLLGPLAAAVLIGLVTVGGAVASTPVTNGYRDQAYGGGAFRPTSDKSQSKLWFTDGSWFAGMFLYKTTAPPKSEYHIYRLNTTTHAWVDTGVVVDTRDKTYGDYLWDEATQTLRRRLDLCADRWTSTDDAIKVFKYTYNATTNVYTPVAGFPHSIPGTASAVGFQGGATSVTITRESTGRLWAVWPKGTQVLYSVSTDGAVDLEHACPAPVPDHQPDPRDSRRRGHRQRHRLRRRASA